MEDKKTIGVLLICTGRYDIFLQPLIESIDTHFFPKDNITIFLFGDKEEYFLRMSPRISLMVIPTKHMPWPYPTLYRYRNFVNAAHHIAKTDYVFYMDADMRIVGDVTEEILSDIIVTRHPGFYANGGWGSDGIPDNSRAYTREDERHHYVAGGFNGGATDKFLEMSRILADNIDYDYSIGYIATYHDESHLNQFVNKQVYKDYPDWKVKDLSPSYCMLPAMDARCAFGLQDLPAIILALDKDHEEFRKN